MFTFTPLNDEELQRLRATSVLQPGDYDFITLGAEEKQSRAGDMMVVVTLKVKRHDGKDFEMKDWLVYSPSMLWKVKNYWECVGHPQQYYNPTVNVRDFYNKAGKVRTKLRATNKLDSEGIERAKQYPHVDEYLKPTFGPKLEIAASDVDLDLPF